MEALVIMYACLLLSVLLAGLAQGSYVPVTHGYGNVHYATATPYMYRRDPADPHYGEQASLGRYPYSYVPAVTHGYGNVHYAPATPYMYRRDPADPHYGEQASQGRYPYSYVPAVTHGYGNVLYATATPYMYRRD